MPSSDRMREFLEVTRAGSISEAARQLGLPRATLSRRMSALEAELSVRLLHRRTTRLVLTTAGKLLEQRAKRIVADVDEAWDAVRQQDDTPRGLLRVSMTGPYFSDLFTGFLCDYPAVQLEVQSTTRHVDLIAEGVDIAMRIGEIKDPELIARRVHMDRSVVVASPAYLDRRGIPCTVKNLADHDCLVGFSGEWSPNNTWPLRAGGTVRVSGRLAANEVDLTRKAALEGLGLALLPSAVVADDLKTQRLQPVLQDIIGKEIPISLVYSDRDYIEPKVRLFVDRAVKIIPREMPKPFFLAL